MRSCDLSVGVPLGYSHYPSSVDYLFPLLPSLPPLSTAVIHKNACLHRNWLAALAAASLLVRVEPLLLRRPPFRAGTALRLTPAVAALSFLLREFASARFVLSVPTRARTEFPALACRHPHDPWQMRSRLLMRHFKHFATARASCCQSVSCASSALTTVPWFFRRTLSRRCLPNSLGARCSQSAIGRISVEINCADDV